MRKIAYTGGMRTSEDRMAERLAKRVTRYGALFEETGDPRYAAIAAEADRLLLRLRSEGA